MADEVTPFTTATTNYGWVKPDVGASNDVWGGLLNTDLDGIDSTVKSISAIANAAYPASNPSGYQTAAQVTTSLGAYLPLAGGTLTGALTPAQTAGLIGTTTNNDANAGSIGEFITAAPGLANLTSGVVAGIASINLTKGDWNVWGQVQVTSSAGVTSLVQAATSISSSAFPSGPTSGAITSYSTPGANIGGVVMPIAMTRFSISATTSVYLIVQANFATGTATVPAGGNSWIMARRVR